ncbi:ion channel [Longimicrobium sp.]|uniref:ion channel n=1 Tax=Longimicrobium sp. TaxID=2029185 RepID=UPI002BF96B75|nr:ion channel [Longimicrobium sp.]HSU15531.1 ion channel [Longimicrobium sp.]
MAALKREDYKDLGFGSVMATEGGRLLNRDGSFNVERFGLKPFESLSVYHSLLTVTWPRFLGMVAAVYVASNAIFGLLYFLCGPRALTGSDGLGMGERYLTAFFFSVHTLATIGYGNVAPNGLVANLLVTMESLVGLLAFALATGVVFARFARPVGFIIFSRNALIAPYRGYGAFMFRIVNGRSNQLIEVNAKVSVSLGRDGERRFHDLPLEREKVVLFPLSWTIVHPIDETSPLWGLSEQDLRDLDAEFFVVLEAIDETFAQQVHSRTSYKPAEIVWGARFADVFVRRDGHALGIDLSKLHDWRPAELPRHEPVPELAGIADPGEPAIA